MGASGLVDEYEALFHRLESPAKRRFFRVDVFPERARAHLGRPRQGEHRSPPQGYDPLAFQPIDRIRSPTQSSSLRADSVTGKATRTRNRCQEKTLSSVRCRPPYTAFVRSAQSSDGLSEVWTAPPRSADAMFRSAYGLFRSANAAFRSSGVPFGSSDEPFRNANAAFRSADGPFRSPYAAFRSAYAAFRSSDGAARSSDAVFRSWDGLFRSSDGDPDHASSTGMEVGRKCMMDRRQQRTFERTAPFQATHGASRRPREGR